MNDNKLFFTYRGRSALQIILRAMGIKKNDYVALQGFTCSAVIEAIMSLEAKPVFIDILKKNLMIDINDLIQKSNIKKPKVVIIQYTFGLYTSQCIEKIKDYCDKNKIYLIEDCCHINPVETFKNKVGNYGDASFFSFEWGKPVVGGIGGAYKINNKKIFLSSENIYEGLKKPSLLKEIIILLQYLTYKFFYNPSRYWILKDLFNMLSKNKIIIGNFSSINFKKNGSNNFQLKSLKITENIVKKKIYNETYDYKKVENILNLIREGNDFFNLIEYHKKNIKFLRIPLLVRNKEKILNLARKSNIELAGWYTSVIHPYNENLLINFGYKNGSCPNAEDLSLQVVSIPISINLLKLKKLLDIIKQNDS